MSDKKYSEKEVRLNIMYATSELVATYGLALSSSEMKKFNLWSEKWCDENLKK